MSNTSFTSFSVSRYKRPNRRIAWLTLLSVPLALIGFITPWISSFEHPGPDVSGFMLATSPRAYQLLVLHQVAPATPVLLWLIPVAALFLFFAGIAQLYWFGLFWLRAWSVFLTGASLVLMIRFCLFQPYVRLQNGFWLTFVFLVLAAFFVLLPRSKGSNVTQQPVAVAEERGLSRRGLLSTLGACLWLVESLVWMQVCGVSRILLSAGRLLCQGLDSQFHLARKTLPGL